MPIRVGTGKSSRLDPAHAGRDATERALQALGSERPHLILVFATVGYEQATLLSAIRETCGDVPLCGCSAEGVISRAGSDETSHAALVMALHADELDISTFVTEGFSTDASRCGADLAAQMVSSAAWERARLILLFPDGLTGNCSELLHALESHLPRRLTIIGGTAGDNSQFVRTYQYHGARTYSDAVTAVLLGGDLEVEIAMSHGCEPIGLDRTITKSDGVRVVEIDGQSAWSVFQSYLDGCPDKIRPIDIVHLCLGEKLSGGDGGPGGLLIRTPLQLDKADRAVIFPGGLREGTVVQMVRRDPGRIRESVIACGDRLARMRPDEQPFVVFQFDCAGRGRLAFGPDASDMIVTPLQSSFATDVPWVGLHTYGEIAPLGEKAYLHNYTVAVCALYGTAD